MSDKDKSTVNVPETQAPENPKLCWYVVHTYSGYENKVMDTLRKAVENSEEMQKLILDIRVPLEEVTDFALEKLDWNDFKYTASPVCVAAVLSPGQNLRIYTDIPDAMPNLRFRYTDGRGNPQCWYITQSGRDGSLMLLGESDL